jgi:hypothetical protein
MQRSSESIACLTAALAKRADGIDQSGEIVGGNHSP